MMRKWMSRILLGLLVSHALLGSSHTIGATGPNAYTTSAAEPQSGERFSSEAITIALPAVQSEAAVYPSNMTEGFEASWPAQGWTLQDQSTTDGGEHLWGKRDCHPRTGSYGGWATGGGSAGQQLACGSSYPRNAATWARYGPFDLSNASSARLTYHLFGTSEGGSGCPYDILFIGSSTDGGQFTGSSFCGDYTGGDAGNGYYRLSFDLADSLGKPQVWVAFLFASDRDTADIGFTIDDLELVTEYSPSPKFNLAWSSAEDDHSHGIAWGDYDRDGDLDLAVAVSSGVNRLYRNSSGSLSSEAVWSSADAEDSIDVAWGDVDGDGDLDLAVANWGAPTRVYRNDGGEISSSPFWSSAETNYAYEVAWADANGDGLYDLAVATWGPIRLYENASGALSTDASWSSVEEDPTFGLAWGDFDGDGDPDLAAANGCNNDPTCYPNRLYRNDANGLTASAMWHSSEEEFTTSVEWGDFDGDGDLDLAAGNGCDADDQCYPNRVYRNDGGMLTPDAVWSTTEEDFTTAFTWGDCDGDGDLDLAAGNYEYQPNRIYRNEHGVLNPRSVWSSTEQDYTDSIAWADVDGDGDLDLAAGNLFGYNRLYRNEQGTLDVSEAWQSAQKDLVESVAWGDVDGDGDLDLAVANLGAANRVYINHGGRLEDSPSWNSHEEDLARSVAWGDFDSDGDLDLAVGNDGPNRVYRNVGSTLTHDAAWSSTESEDTRSIAWGDIDGDGDVDLIVGNLDAPNRMYRNDSGTLTSSGVWATDLSAQTEEVALGDVDGDGDLDLVSANWGPNHVYLNHNGHLDISPSHSSIEDSYSSSLAWGDFDDDGDLDLAVGNHRQSNCLQRNDEGVLSACTVWSSAEADPTFTIAWGDYDGDGDLDLASGNNWGQQDRIYRNDRGVLNTNSAWASAQTWATSSLAWGDYDADGDLDLAVGNSRWDPSQSLFASESVRIYANHRDYYGEASSIPVVSLHHPGLTDAANHYSSSTVQADGVVSVTYTLLHHQSAPVREVKGFYSLNGGGDWQIAVPTASTITTNLTSQPKGEAAASSAGTHVYSWDVFASGVMGQYDNVVFRLVALPSLAPSPDTIAGPYRYGQSSATSFPFRVRGSQVRVTQNGEPVADAVVYRLSAEHISRGSPYSDSAGESFRTNGLGYLQGHGDIAIGDRLLALAPIVETDLYTLYFTNGTPSPDGVQGHRVTTLGEQTIEISEDHPLYLFNLDVSLEWDAHSDQTYMQQLRFDLLRSAEHLYDFSNGLASLGEVYIFHDAENWQTANLRIYAGNRLRPNATLGGVISDTLTDLLEPTISYEPGQIRMPATWNRYGDPSTGSVGEDWPRTLAHEFGHYFLFLDDHYLGFDPGGQVISMDTCTDTAMTDPYRYSEYRDQANWLPDCQDTIANHLTGRSDWSTISLYYPELRGPDLLGANDGPVLMPFTLPEVSEFGPITPTVTIADPTFYFLTPQGQRYQPGDGTRGFLIKQDTWMVDIGEPVVDHILARGASAEDRLCVFDYVGERHGCETISPGDDQMVLYSHPGWWPEIVVSPVSTDTVDVTAYVDPSLPLFGRVFSTDGPVTDSYALSEVESGKYTARMSSSVGGELLLEGFVHLWVDEEAPRRETITDYSIGASPGAVRGHGGAVRGHGGAVRGHGGAVRGHGGAVRGHGAPVLSGDGQLTVYTPDPIIPEGEFVTIQTATGVPELPPGRTLVGNAYRIDATDGMDSLSSSSVSFQYMGEAVPAGMEQDLTIYSWNDTQSSWRELPTTLNLYDNFASTQADGEGLYALLTSFRVPLYASGWNLFSYPLRLSQPVSDALVSVSGVYTTVYGYSADDYADPWKLYDVTVPSYANDLSELEFGRGYWINVSEPASIYFSPHTDSGLLQAASVPPHVPSSFYGRADGAIAGDEITAWVGSTLCGRTTVMSDASRPVYAIDVSAEAGGVAGCGVNGAAIEFRCEDELLRPGAVWDDRQVWHLDLTSTGGYRSFLPLTEGRRTDD